VPVEQRYRYVGPSALGQDGLTFATSGGRTANPYVFSGAVVRADEVARGLLTVAEVARTRFFDPGASQRSLDPVVTSNRSVLRFESFSGCNGVYARLDVGDDGFAATHLDWGTTNVDVNEPLRAALSSVGSSETLGLQVGRDELVVSVGDTEVVERQVPLPPRWVRGFAEVQLAAAGMVRVAQLGTAAARAVLRDLPASGTGNRAFWVRVGPGGARLSNRPDGDAPSLVGPHRLAPLRRLVPYVRSLDLFAEPARGRLRTGGTRSQDDVLRASAWVVSLDTATLTLLLSPELYRGFSGEGAALEALVTADRSAVDRVGASLAGQARLAPDDLAALAGSRTAAIDALRVLGAGGRVGYDLVSDAHFHRDLPVDRDALEVDQPRLLGARELVDDGAVRWTSEGATVRSGDAEYRVRDTPAGSTCTCVWFAKHRGERGPCKHVLAAQLARLAERDPEVLP
jgi:hypothetical protein